MSIYLLGQWRLNSQNIHNNNYIIYEQQRFPEWVVVGTSRLQLCELGGGGGEAVVAGHSSLLPHIHTQSFRVNPSTI